MKSLQEVFHDVDILDLKGDFNIEISGIFLNSKEVIQDSLFIALTGNATDGHLYIPQAVEKGARVIVYEKEIIEFKDGITYIKVDDTHDTCGKIASAFYDHPSQKLKLVGVTGTNGKTTTTTLLHNLFRKLGYKTGMIGTVVNKINDDSYEAERTTPDPVSLQKLLADMVQVGCSYCFMEVSSHAVSEKRISGLVFACGVFTNLTLDHLDYHETFENYRDAKRAFFDSLLESACVVSNKDDNNGDYMLSHTKAKKYFYSLKTDADFTDRLETKLIGEFNAYNALAIYSTALALGEDPEQVKEIMKTLEPVEGRFQYFKNEKGITGIVDYAHTPDALENVLRTINDMKGTSRVISVFGCGGDRDKTKRPIMASLGYNMSDFVILTSDNPRTEDPDEILRDMQKGIDVMDEDKVLIIADRKEAIKKACQIANEGDYILLAGKGHEKYQEVNGEKSHFDDMEELQKYLA